MWRDADLTCFLTILYLFWHTSGLKVSTNERTSWICVLDEGDSAGVPQDSF